MKKKEYLIPLIRPVKVGSGRMICASPATKGGIETDGSVKKHDDVDENDLKGGVW